MGARITDSLAARKRILDAQEATRRVQQKRLEEAAESYRAYREFFNRLALLAGGTVALSVTYLGYLKTLAVQPAHLWLLIASWGVLLLCLVSSTFYSFFHTAYIGYARSAEYALRLKEQHETAAEEVGNISIAGVETRSDLESYIAQLQTQAKVGGDDVRWNRRRSRIFEFIYRMTARTANVSFLVGLSLLLAFAILNIHVPEPLPSISNSANYMIVGRSDRSVTDAQGTHAVVDFVLERESHKIYANCDLGSIGKLDGDASCAMRPLHTYACELQTDKLSEARFPLDPVALLH